MYKGKHYKRKHYKHLDNARICLNKLHDKINDYSANLARIVEKMDNRLERADEAMLFKLIVLYMRTYIHIASSKTLYDNTNIDLDIIKQQQIQNSKKKMFFCFIPQQV